MVLDQQHIDKLFFRFPNLEDVCLSGLGLITNFNEDQCKSFLSHCPKLRSFDVVCDAKDPRIDAFLLKVQPLLTIIRLSDCSHSNAMEIINFVTQFSHLRSIVCKSESLGRLDLFLPIFEQLSNVTTLYLGLDDDMEEGWEDYVPAKSQETRDQLIKRLSNITDLTLNAYSNISNTLQFMSQYFTGLNCLDMERDLEVREPDEEQDLFCRNLFNLIHSVKVMCFIELHHMHFTSLVRNFSSLIQNTFLQKLPTGYKQLKSRILEISIRDWGFVSPHLVNLNVESLQSPFSRKIAIDIDQEFQLSVIAGSLLKGGAPMNEVDVLVLHFDSDISYETPVIDTNDYLDVLETMPSLKQVILDVPPWYLETAQEGNQSYSGPILSLVEEATFNVLEDGTMQTLLDSCYFAFPNLKRLTIKDSSGVWNASLGEFQVCLSDYSFKKLTLDASPLMEKMNQFFDSLDVFFLLDVEIQSLCERRLYKVSRDLISHELISSHDLKNLKRRKDYLSLRLVVNSLAQVKLWWNGSYTIIRSCIIILEESE